jgi:hypothetical protein
MPRLIGLFIAIIVSVLMIINAAFMLTSPERLRWQLKRKAVDELYICVTWPLPQRYPALGWFPSVTIRASSVAGLALAVWDWGDELHARFWSDVDASRRPLQDLGWVLKLEEARFTSIIRFGIKPYFGTITSFAKNHQSSVDGDPKSQIDLTGQLLKDMSVVHPTTNKPHTLTHHFE